MPGAVALAASAVAVAVSLAGAPTAAALPEGACGARPAPRRATSAVAEKQSPLIYLNRCAGGCDIIAASEDDARTNRSSIATRDARVPAFAHSQQVWKDVVACVAEIYRPYDVEITEVDPGNQPHHEAVVAGVSSDIGLDGGMGGVAIVPCEPQNNLISFTFANFYDGNARTICEIVAHETAHAFGLVHVMNCRDPMTYLESCDLRFFRDEESTCGEFESAPCECGGTELNSHQTLLGRFGPGLPTPNPDLDILLPSEGDTVPLGFSVYAEAYSERGLAGVELWLNDTLTKTLRYQRNNRRYIFETGDVPVADGIIDIEVRVADDLGSRSVSSVTVTKGDPCVLDDDCLAEQRCGEGRCFYIASQSPLGEACDTGVDCQSGVCEDVAGEALCTDYCNPDEHGSCESPDFECVSAGEGGLCWPRDTGEEVGGCCQVGRSAPSPGSALLALLAAVWIARPRRRTRSRTRTRVPG